MDYEKAELRSLRLRAKELEKELARMTVQLASAEKERELAVQNAELRIRVELQKKVEEAFDKGYNRCREGLKLLKSLSTE